MSSIQRLNDTNVTGDGSPYLLEDGRVSLYGHKASLGQNNFGKRGNICIYCNLPVCAHDEVWLGIAPYMHT